MASQDFGQQRKWAIILIIAVLGVAAWWVLGRGSALTGLGMEAAKSEKAGNAANVLRSGDGEDAVAGFAPGTGSPVGGDALGRRFNENDDLVGEQAPPAKPLPVVAAKGEVIGYTKDANGKSTPIYANASRIVPNTPGTYVAVDMWADGGARVVPARQLTPLSPAEERGQLENRQRQEQSRNQ